MAIWNLPETKRLEAQTLDKLALAPWGDTLQVDWKRVTNFSEHVMAHPQARLLRPLLQDLLDRECWLSFAQRTNGAAAVTLVVRLDNTRAALWQSNLGGLQHMFEPNRKIVASRSNDYVVIKILPETNSNTTSSAEEVWRLPPATNWLTAEVSGWPLFSNRLFADNPPMISMAISGDEQGVRVAGDLQFSKPLNILFKEWLPPTNRMPHPLVGLTAVRGIAPALQKLKVFSDLETATLPGQAFLWHRPGPPVQLFFALPAANPQILLERLTPPIIDTINSNAPLDKFGFVQRTNNVLLWTYFQYASPHLSVSTNENVAYLAGGMGVQGRETNAIPPELHRRMLEPTNLIYFDWEVTSERMGQFRYLDDVARMTLDEAHRPRLLERSAALQWLGAVVTNHLKIASTVGTLEATNRIHFSRKSQTGFTAFELNLLLNWLERPDFPSGFEKFFEIDHTPPPSRRR